MALKAQDIYVVLKIVADGMRRAPYAQLAAELKMSASEVHACIRRAEASHLLHTASLQGRPNIEALEEFLVHGLKYAFPAEHSEFTRGIPTSYGAEPLRRFVAAGNEPVPVWPCPQGTQRGFGFAPLYKSAPFAARRDQVFYGYLALADALRDGRARDRGIAQKELHRRLQEASRGIQS